MKRIKILLSIVLIIIFMMTTFNVSAYYVAIDTAAELEAIKDLKNDGIWYYMINEQSEKATIYAYNGDDADVVIPEMIDGYKVEHLCLRSDVITKGGYHTTFPVFDKKIKTLTLPKTIELISSNVSYIGYVNHEKYDDYEVDTLYHNDKKIVDGYFRLRDVDAINVADDNPYFSSVDGILYDKKITTLISYPEGKKEEKYTVPDTVTTIMDNAFWEMAPSLKEIVITENVSVLGYNSIYSNRQINLEKITILNNVLGKKQLSRIFANDILDTAHLKVTVYKDSPAHKYYSKIKDIIVLDNPYIEKNNKTDNKKEESKGEKTESKDTSSKKEQSTVNKSQKDETQKVISKQDDDVSRTESLGSVDNTDNTASEDKVIAESKTKPTRKNNLPKIIIISILAALIIGFGITTVLVLRRKNK